MELDIVHLEVDGSLSNPAVLAAVVTWTVVLSGVTWLIVSWIQAPLPGSESAWRGRRRIGYSLLAFLFVSTFITKHLLADAFYRFVWGATGPYWSVGFWGGPPMSPALGLSALVGVLGTRRDRARVLRAQQLPK